jgi:hypothetical protein
VRPFDDSADAHNRYSTSLLIDMKTSTASVLTRGVLHLDQRTSNPRYRSDDWVRLAARGTPPPSQDFIFTTHLVDM